MKRFLPLGFLIFIGLVIVLGSIYTSKPESLPVWKTIRLGNKTFDLVKVSLQDLGFFEIRDPFFEEIFKQADRRGLVPCSVELAEKLRADYADEPGGEYLLVMTPIRWDMQFELVHMGRYPVVPPLQLSAPWISYDLRRLAQTDYFDSDPNYKHYLVFVRK